MVYGLFESLHTFQAIALVKRQVRFVGYAIRGGSVNDGFVESEDGVFFISQVSGYLIDIRV